MAGSILQQILRDKIIAIVRGIPGSFLPDLAQALFDGGIRCLEITFDQSGARSLEETCKDINTLISKFGDDLLVGAGTVLTVQQARLAAGAGARYILSPNVNLEVIRETKRLELVSIPGAFTPSEAVAAYETGADIVKLFPADTLGPSYIKAFRGPLPHIPVFVVGGINLKNIGAFIQAGAAGAGIGGNLADARLVKGGDYSAITELAGQYVAALAEYAK